MSDHKAIPIYRGWEEIGKALEVSDDTAAAYAARTYDPLPVYYDHAGRPCIVVSALEDWEARSALPFYAFHELRATGRLPSQIAGEEGRPAAARTKVARRARHARVNSGQRAQTSQKQARKTG